MTLNLKDMIELDTYGFSDHSIELSSDEEAPGDDVRLLFNLNPFEQ